jgi:hypothetical protein
MRRKSRDLTRMIRGGGGGGGRASLSDDIEVEIIRTANAFRKIDVNYAR